jgi:hypothetical protein
MSWQSPSRSSSTVKLPRALEARLEQGFIVVKFQVLRKAFPVKTAVRPREPECIQWSPLQVYVVITAKGLRPRLGLRI